MTNTPKATILSILACPMPNCQWSTASSADDRDQVNSTAYLAHLEDHYS